MGGVATGGGVGAAGRRMVPPPEYRDTVLVLVLLALPLLAVVAELLLLLYCESSMDTPNERLAGIGVDARGTTVRETTTWGGTAGGAG